MARDYDLIVFDWDGTLMDSIGKIVACMRSAIADVGVANPGDAAIRHIIGLGLAEAIRTLLPAESDATHAATVERYREHFLHRDQTASPLFAGVTDGLERLAQQGYLLAIATGKARRGLERVLGETTLGSYFVATRCADEARSKPHPQMLEDILDLTGTDPARAIMIGDTVYDLEMARSARVDSLGVTYGVHARAQLAVHAPRTIVDSFPEVCVWLNAPYSVAANS
jgi:phosphoglycolate phosphatase